MPKFKGYKAIAILVIVLLTCLTFGTVASAKGGSDIAQLDPNVVKGSHTYNFDFELPVNLDAVVLGDQDITIQFPTVTGGTQFDVSQAGHTIPVGLAGSDHMHKYMQVIPTVDNTNHTITIHLDKPNLPMSGEVKWIKVEDLTVKTTCVPDTYSLCVSSPCFTIQCMGLRVVETVGSITITEPVAGTTSPAGTTLTVSGEVTNVCGDPWPYDTWPVIIDVLDHKGLPAIDPSSSNTCCPEVNESVTSETLYQPDYCCIDPCTGSNLCPVIAHTVYTPGVKTTFTQTITVPACWKYGQDYTIRARTLEVKDNNCDTPIDYYEAFTVTPDLVPAEGIEDGAYPHLYGIYKNDGCGLYSLPHAWLATETAIISGPGVAAAIKQMVPINALTNPTTEELDGLDVTYEGKKIHNSLSTTGMILANKPAPVKIQVVDKFCHPTVFGTATKVDLAAWYWDGGKQIAGVFYDKDPRNDSSAKEIVSVNIPAGQGTATVYFVPNFGSVGHKVYVEERTIIGGTLIVAQCTAVVEEAVTTTLLIEPKVTVCPQGQPRAGWPLKAEVWLDEAASEDYAVRVELYDPASTNQSPCNFATWATWDTDLNVCFNKKGANEGRGDVYDEDGDTLICPVCHGWATYTHPYCTNKSVFYIYIDQSAEGKTLNARVKLTGNTTGQVIYSDYVKVGPFASPVELTRALDADTWQTLSTPKYLANARDCTKYGTFTDLLPAGSYDTIAYYKDGKWNFIFGQNGGDDVVVEPLVCYYLRMHQRLTPGPNADYWTASYIYARADDPSEMIPPVRTLGLGWNSVGVSVSYNCNSGVPGAVQGDMAYHFLGSICNGCKLIYNPGVSLGNINGMWTVLAVSQGTAPSWYNDPNYPVFNGDNYWVYLTQTQDLAANIGLDLVDP